MDAVITEKNILEANIEEQSLSCVLSELIIKDLIYVKYNGDTVTYLGMPIVLGKEVDVA